MKKSFIYFLIALIISSFLLIPSLDFQPYLSQGDHGRDLYAYFSTQNGGVPYQDYWWVYGPLMPYYYAWSLDTFGTNIYSILVGQLALTILAGLFFFLICSNVTSLPLGCLATIWFFVFHQKFYYTYNHIGGLVCILALLYCIILYLKIPKPKYQIASFILIFILSLIKLNFGIVFLATFIILNLLIDRYQNVPKKERFYLICFFCVLSVVFVIYYVLLHKLPFDQIRQYFPFSSADRVYNASLSTSFFILVQSIWHNMSTGWSNRFLALIVVLSIIQAVAKLRKNDLQNKTQVYFTFVTFICFYMTCLHEFLVSGVYYRSYWAQPISFLLMFYVIYFASNEYSKLTRNLFYCAIALILSIQISSRTQALSIIKSHNRYLSLNQGQIYINNSPEWIDTITKTTHFINNNLKENELFFALPYDPIYYFFTQKKSPTSQIIFFEYLSITNEIERKIIVDLEKNNVNWILLSSMKNANPGLGTLGKTYCPLINQYIMDNFEIVAQFGEWTKPAGWSWNHGVRMLRRK